MQQPSTPPAAYSSPKRKRGDLDFDHSIDFSPNPSRLRTESPPPPLESELKGEGSPRTVVAGQFSALNITKEGPMPKLKLELAAEPTLSHRGTESLHEGGFSIEDPGKHPRAALQPSHPIPGEQIDRLFLEAPAQALSPDVHEFREKTFHATVGGATLSDTNGDRRPLMVLGTTCDPTSPPFAESRDSKDLSFLQGYSLCASPSSAPANAKAAQEPEVPETPNIRPSSPSLRAPLRLKSPPPLNLASTGSELIAPESSFDDLTGVNGIGFRPTPAMAYARAQRRKQQIADCKSREAREARQRRSERRAGRVRVEIGEGMRDGIGFEGRKVRFVEG